MTHRSLRSPHLVVVLALFGALACVASPDRTTAPAETRAVAPDLAPLVAAQDAAWNAHDPDGLAALFVDDGVAVTPSGRRVEGRAALRELFAEAGPTKQTSSSSRIDSVRPLGSELALLTATQTLTGPGVEQLGSSRARLVAIARRDDHSWRFVEAHIFAMPGDRGTP